MKALSVFLGYDAREHDAYEVADFSIRRRASLPALITPLVLSNLGHVMCRPVERRDGRLWCPISQAPMSTEFAISRFCVPFLQREGWALFTDCDVLAQADIAELFALADPRYAVQVVKHPDQRPKRLEIHGEKSPCGCRETPPRETWTQALKDGLAVQFYASDYTTLKVRMAAEFPQADVWYTERNGDPIAMLVPKGTPPSALPKTAMDYIALEWIDPDEDFSHLGTQRQDTKMDGQTQTYYARKNWSSVVLWNCSHPAHARLTHDRLNHWPGRDLHAFKWLEDSEIGELPQTWNWLAGITQGDVSTARLIHLTTGGPWFPEWTGGPCDELWIRERCALSFALRQNA